ncbi:DUF4272 domain-containing protein [Puia dinghuensis]|uniref:DUF4272 domain-containing protein n=1 Tax=Puia dinghuensis TaxID=1792502 RepID=A0A8J2UD25_9BACT|nr:DUF4272 domain-containing protein [Puia dinghuensis]GGB00401.1 hypothetical protein GCM10011511_24580 [Puia dinghuensis]
MKSFSVILSILLLSGIVNAQEKPLSGPTKRPEHIDPTPDQKARRQQSEAFCKEHDIPIFKNPHALFVDAESKVTIRETDTVLDRALALCYIGMKGEGMPDEQLAAVAKDWKIMDKLSPKEKEFIAAERPTPQQRTDAIWRYESLHVLLWAMGFIDSLGYPDQQCSVTNDLKVLHDLTEQQLRAKATLRSKKEILDQADLILRIHWAIEDARAKGDPVPGGINPDVVQERYCALNWLIRNLGLDWDDVQTNT